MSEPVVQPAAVAAPAPAGLSQWQRIASTFTSPSRVFADIRAGHRSWWLPFVLTVLASYLFFGVVYTKIGMQQVVTNSIHMSPKAEERMAQVPPEQREMSNKIALISTEVAFAATPVFVIGGILLLSLGLMGTVNFVMGGKAKYWDLVSVWMYAGLPGLIKVVLGIAVIYAGLAPESFNIQNFAPTNLGAFLNPMETNAGLYSLATSLDFVSIWSMALLGIGTAAVAGVKRSSGYIAVFGWWAIFVIIGAAYHAVAG